MLLFSSSENVCDNRILLILSLSLSHCSLYFRLLAVSWFRHHTFKYVWMLFFWFVVLVPVSVNHLLFRNVANVKNSIALKKSQKEFHRFAFPGCCSTQTISAGYKQWTAPPNKPHALIFGGKNERKLNFKPIYSTQTRYEWLRVWPIFHILLAKPCILPLAFLRRLIGIEVKMNGAVSFNAKSVWRSAKGETDSRRIFEGFKKCNQIGGFRLNSGGW